MGLARGLLPYLAAAAAIAGGSTALLIVTVDQVTSGAPRPGAGRAAPELSTTGRLAYWRQTPQGAFVLWAANLDGSDARPLVTLPPNASRPFGTRWTANGLSVGYVSDTGIAVIALDGSRSDFVLPQQIRNQGFRVIDHRWSPSGAKLAATIFRSTDGASEVYVGHRDRRELVQGYRAGNSFVSDWISEDEVLVEGASGILAALRMDTALLKDGIASSSFRRLFGQSAASPFFDGSRVYFLAGGVGATGNASGIFVGNPAVWSVLPDGTDSRREARFQVAGALRLDGLWPDGRYLMHIFGDTTQWLGGPNLATLATNTLLRRVVVSADQRSAIGFGGSRIVRIDLSRGTTPSEGSFVVLLDGVIGADAWVRKPHLP